ncbi:MAG: 4-hydroxy-tetrahydrodipicolinate synthase [Deltaproteobacteria bacterium]|nr:4-hydroxy-tetrahydrodipicolinate synthase [Deltaproteobacteria bacterium]
MKRFKGAFTALVTPFKNGRIDRPALKRLIEFQIKDGINGLVPCGTTGEAATLSYEEHDRMVNLTIEYAKGRVPVIAGTGSNSTEETIMLTKHANKAGAEAALLITPYYNKPTQRGLYEHYKKIASECDMPIILYNVPSRTAVNLLPETVAKLSEIENIIGIKEAAGNLEQASEIISLSRKDFIVLSGDDFTTLPLLSVGGHGVVSVTSNIVPRDVSRMCFEFFAGNLHDARGLHYKLFKLHRMIFIETNPIPVKTALSLMGIVGPEMRMPLVNMEGANLLRLKDALKGYRLI